ncbi:MAG: tetratricopeptide repeat protein [Azoarcus sp.]|jgi:tetratricopeptide (TPR) repeat protein|nr:tetratricopeptide repeat protein [Azoarcus sp.]
MKLKQMGVALMMALGLSCNASGGTTVLERLREMHQMLMDPEQIFSISATMTELDALAAKIPSGDSPARGEVDFLRGYVHGRKGESAEAVHFTREALRIDAVTSFLTENDRNYALYRLAVNAKDAGEWEIAIDAYKRVIPRFARNPALDDSQRLGMQENLGFCLHEAGKYAEAMTINKKVLAGGERLFGAKSPELLNVINNLAQNAYELKDYVAARIYLERRLKIAAQHEEVFHVDDSLFQLGVLAFEQGQPKEAEDFMKRRLELARKSGDEDRIKNAEEDLRVLYEKGSDA